MKYREKLGYIALGGFLMLVGMLAAGLFTPLRAQNDLRDAEFGTITCREIKVVDADGKIGASMGISEDGGIVSVIGNGGIASMGVNELGGIVLLFNKDFDGALMCADKDGGRVELRSKDSETKVLTGKGLSDGNITCSSLKVKSPSGATLVWIGSDEDGGLVVVRGRDINSSVGINIDEDGGNVHVYGKGNPVVSIGVNDDGGRVAVYGKNSVKDIVDGNDVKFSELVPE